MLDLPDLLKNMVEGISIGGDVTYSCPACEREYDVEAVRRITARGEWPVCKDCGEDLVMEEE